MRTITKVAIASSAALCATVLSLGWSDQGGVSLSVDKAQARVGRPLTPVSVAGVARRQNRRAAYGGYRYGLAGAAALGTAAAVGTAAAIANSPYSDTGYYEDDSYSGQPYYGPGAWGARAAYYGPGPAVSTAAPAWTLVGAYHAGGPWYGGYGGGWEAYKATNGIVCDPGTLVKGADGVQYLCQ